MYLALLRGINVGGKNVIRMGDLRAAFEDMGFTDVRTFIQSGNVLFRSRSNAGGQITATIERALSRRFAYQARVVVKSRRQYEAALKCAPATWGKDAARKHNAIFTVAGTSPAAIFKRLPPLRPELEEAGCGPGVIFWSASLEGIARTAMMKLAAQPIYTELTVRNHKTTLALRELLGE